MGATANLANESQTIGSGMDSVVIRKYGSGIIGGRTLDVTNVATDVIKAGHVIIRSATDDTDYKPMPVEDGAYDTLPSGYEYAGVLVRSITKKEPLAAIMYAGEVNDKASPYPVDSIKSAMKTALPGLVFMHD